MSRDIHKHGGRMRRLLSSVLVFAMLLLLCSCQQTSQLLPFVAETTPRPRVTVTPAPTLTNAPAILYEGVNTDQRVVSLVFEGYTDAATMSGLISLLSERNVNCIFFATGSSALDYPETLKSIVDAGFPLGNYGITAKKKMEEASTDANIHQFSRTQELIQEACGLTPTLFRCNQTIHTREVLQAAAACGLKAGVNPTFFLNHRSFAEAADAAVYVQRLSRGAIISVKLGQALDEDEYGYDLWRNHERPANDPAPGIADEVHEINSSIYSNVVPVVGWLLDALGNDGYRIVSPQQLQGYDMEMLGSPRELDDAELSLLSTEQYTLPLTAEPLTYGKTRPGTTDDFADSVFVGDATVLSLKHYVDWVRRSNPTFLDGAQFLATSQLSVETSLAMPGPLSYHPEYNGVKVSLENQLLLMSAKRVYLLLRCDDGRAYANKSYLQNYKLLLHLIKSKNPTAEICVLSLPPGMDYSYQRPTNMQLFRFNLFLAELCREYGLCFLDVAYYLRTDTGALNPEYCIDPNAHGTNLNDSGLNVLLDVLLQNIPLASGTAR